MSILIVGGGTIGASLAQRLSSSESKVVVMVEASDDRVRHLRDTADVQVIHGSGGTPACCARPGSRTPRCRLSYF